MGRFGQNLLLLAVSNLGRPYRKTGDGHADPLYIVPLFFEVECYFCTAADFNHFLRKHASYLQFHAISCLKICNFGN